MSTCRTVTRIEPAVANADLEADPDASPARRLWIVIIGAGVAAVTLCMVWPLAGGAVAWQSAGTVLTAALLCQRFTRLNRHGEWDRIVGELTTPALLWLLFGFGGIACLLNVSDLHLYGVRFSSHAVLMFALYAAMAALCFMAGFRMVRPAPAGTAGPGRQIALARAPWLLLLVLVMDWYVRFQLIRSGLYFTWVMKAALDKPARGTSLLFHIQRTIAPVGLALLVYLIVSTERKRLFGLILLGQVLLISANGDRSDLLLALLVIV